MHKVDPKHFSTAIMAMVVVLGFLSACGKKGPPVAPDLPPLPAVTTLTAELSGDRVALQWRSPPASEKVAGYVVYRAAEPLSAPPCPGCPLTYASVATLPVDGPSGAMRFIERVSPGFRYSYKVRPYGSGRRSGPDSSPVAVDVP